MFAGARFQDDRECVVCVLMTTACAVPELVDGIKHRRGIPCLQMVIQFVVVGMTTGAVRLVDSGFPADVLGITGVAILAAHLDTMPTREQW